MNASAPERAIGLGSPRAAAGRGDALVRPREKHKGEIRGMGVWRRVDAFFWIVIDMDVYSGVKFDLGFDPDFIS